MKTRYFHLPILILVVWFGIATEAQADLEAYCNSARSNTTSMMAQDMIAAMNRARLMGKEVVTHRLGLTSTINYGSRVIYDVRDSEIVFPVKAKIKFCQLNSMVERNLISQHGGWIFSDQVEQSMFSPLPNGFGLSTGPSPAQLLAMRRAVCEIYEHRETLAAIFTRLPRHRQWWEGDLAEQSSIALRTLGTLAPAEEIQARAFTTLVKKLGPSERRNFLDEVQAGKNLDEALESVARYQQSSQKVFETISQEFFRMTTDNIFAGFRLCQNRSDIEALSKEIMSQATFLK